MPTARIQHLSLLPRGDAVRDGDRPPEGRLDPRSRSQRLGAALRADRLLGRALKVPRRRGVRAGRARRPAAGLGSLFCWVAREVYGDENVRWVLFRDWMLNNSPRWFRKLYMDYGPAFAKWLRNKPRVKNVIRKMMDAAIQRGVVT